MMRNVEAAAFAITAVTFYCSIASAQETVPTDVFVEVPAVSPFTWTTFNGRLIALGGASPKRIIDRFAPGLPVVGVRHLPPDVRFNIDLSDTAFTRDTLLSGLGKKLGLEITIRDVMSDFIIVRNQTIGVPKSWERSSKDTEGEISQVDERDGLYLATQTSMTLLVGFLTDHDNRPILNQCALRERYNFSFTFADQDVFALLKSFGFEVKLEKRKAEAIVIQRPNAKG
ncbi:MAG TPA: hypothetical protein QF564_19695 [Pirellulaceae bacterium]|jgi:hypothetical protein|nr:hypothetical protein [Pirellulaceae bacterium]